MLNINSLCTRAITAIPLVLVAGAAHAQNAFFPTNATLDGSNPVHGDAYVGYANFDDYLNEVNGTSPTVTMTTGASIDSKMQTFNGSTLNILDGTIGAVFGNLLGYDSSTVNMSGGIANQEAQFQFNSTFNFSGGMVGDDLTMFDSSRLNMTGGTVGHSLLMNANSVDSMSGGVVTADIFVQDQSSFTMFGTDLAATLTDPNFQGFYSQFTLSGHLADGTDVTGKTVDVQNGSGATFSVAAVPEPTTILGLLGLVAVVRQRKQKSA